MTQPTDRPGIDDLTSDMLDQLYARLENAERKAEAMTAAMRSTATDALKHRGCHMKLMAQCTRAERAEATLTAVRKLHAPVQYRRQTICGHCSGYGGDSCDNGTHLYPCATITVLDQHGQTTA